MSPSDKPKYGITVPISTSDQIFSDKVNKRASVLSLEQNPGLISPLFLSVRLQSHRGREPEADPGSDLDPDPALFHLHAGLGGRGGRRNEIQFLHLFSFSCVLLRNVCRINVCCTNTNHCRRADFVYRVCVCLFFGSRQSQRLLSSVCWAGSNTKCLTCPS